MSASLRFHVILIGIVCILCGVTKPVWAQKADTTAKTTENAAPSDTTVTPLLHRLEDISRDLNHYNSILRRGFDTTEVAEQLPPTEQLIKIINTVVLSSRRSMNLRSMNAIKAMLLQLEENHEKWQDNLFKYSSQLTEIDNQLTRISTDSSLRHVPEDPALKLLYGQQIEELRPKWEQVAAQNKKAIQKIGVLQNRVASNYIAITDILDELSYRIRTIQKQIFRQEEAYLWKARPADYKQDFGAVSINSVRATGQVLRFYLFYNQDILIIIALMGLLFTWWVIHNYAAVRKNYADPDTILASITYLKRNRIAGCLAFTFTISPFVFPQPPLALMELFWMLQTFVLWLLAWRTWKAKDRRVWFSVMILLCLFSLANSLADPSLGERYLHLAGQIIGLAVAVYLIFNKSSYEPVPHNFNRVVVWVFTIQIGLAFICNVFGRLTLSKYLSLGAALSAIEALALFIVTEIILEAIYLQVEAHKNSNRLASFFDYNRIKQSLTSFLFLVAGICWVFILLRNLNMYEGIRDYVIDFFSKDRKIGTTVITYGSIFIFILVLWISVSLSKVLVFIFGKTQGQAINKKSRWGNAILLVRLGIIGAGILLAFIASGIPMDKLAIIIGALGVGIGFGLQNVVNNLVSGIILAFERPIEVGDIIEVEQQYGTVKEIGIRSSKIVTLQGSEVIIPNGDLLSHHITNWTLTNQYRRAELLVGVGYDTDLRQARQILSGILEGQKDVHTNPKFKVLVHQFNDSTIDIRILFWADIDLWVDLKSEILTLIHEKFNENGIEIAFPQQDIHIKSMPDFLQPKPENNETDDAQPD